MTNKLGKVRVIGGKWRGTKLGVLQADGLRPTTDRVKETLFNWLSKDLVGARCLDLFSGSGALGIEAVSRGALDATLVEHNKSLVQEIESLLERLGAHNIKSIQADGVAWLIKSGLQFDIVFLDPPFDTDLADSCLSILSERGLSEQALVYLERPRLAPSPPKIWRVLKSAHTRDVSYMLLQKIQRQLEPENVIN